MNFSLIFEKSRNDIVSGILVGFLALPLSMGIAAASGFPITAGLVTAIVAGLVAPLLGSAPLSIKGPAAGLIIIVADGITELNHVAGVSHGLRFMLTAGAVAACLQIFAGKWKLTRYLEAVPPAVVHGMLAGIGVIIFSKQLPVLLGVSMSGMSPIEILSHIPSMLHRADPLSFIIGGLSLGFLLFAARSKNKFFKTLPAPVLLLFFAVVTSYLFSFNQSRTLSLFGFGEINISPSVLVNIPSLVFSSIAGPDWNALKFYQTYEYALLLFLVGSIESTLTLRAIDSITNAKTSNNTDKDLFALGFTNLAAALLGGMPMISEIARSRANIEYNAKSSKSLFVHSAFILVMLLGFTSVLSMVPSSVLAAMLIVIGFRLASPAEFRKTLEIGRDQLLIFCTTMALTVWVDLLIGLIAGIALKFVVHRLRVKKTKDLITYRAKKEQDEAGNLKLLPEGALVFSNVIQLSKDIDGMMKKKSKLTIDLSQTQLVDHTVLNKLKKMESQYDNLELKGLLHLQSKNDHPLSVKYSHMMVN